MKKLNKIINNITSNSSKSLNAKKKSIENYINKKPYKSFFIILGIFVLLIVMSNILGSVKPIEKKLNNPPKTVHVYTIGSVPKLTVQAQIEKSEVIHLTALTPGVVQAIYTDLGQSAVKGQTLVVLSTNYQGGNNASLARELAQTQYKNVLDTYDTNKEIIKKQKEIAEKVDASADELRSITDKSIGETQSLVDLNNTILTSLDKNIENLEQTNVNGANDALILSSKQLKSQFLAATNQANQALRLVQFNASADKPPTEISNLQKDVTIKQLELQEKMLDVTRDVSRIQVQIAKVSEAMMYPASPVNGTVQKISVKVGETVNPGTELMILSSSDQSDSTVAIAYVSRDIANKISKIEPSTLHLNNTTIQSFPVFISTEAISGSLYGVFFPIPEENIPMLTEKGFITVDLPIGYADTSVTVPFIPIDAVYQTKEQNYVFVEKNGKAEAKYIKLGEVFGNFVQVEAGIGQNDRVIVNRNVIARDKVKVQE